MSDPAGWGGFSGPEMGDLIQYLEPWFETRGGGGIRQVTSRDKTVRVRRPFGPVVDLGASTSAVLFDYTLDAPKVSIDTLNDGPDAGLLGQQFEVLEFWFSGRNDGNIAQSNANIRFNHDGGTNYDVIGAQSSSLVVSVNQTSNNQHEFPMPGNLAVAGKTGAIRFSIPNYTSTVQQKAGEAQGGFESSGDSMVRWGVFFWRPTVVEPVTRIEVLSANGNWIEGTRLTVVGR